MSKTKKTIVIIEDENILQKALNIEVLSAGYEVISASNGEAGLEVIKKTEPDLVLLDLVMPSMNGFEVIEKMKKSKATKNIPIIVLSNLGQEEDKKKALKMGADDYFVKSSTNLEYVTEKIENVLSKQ